LPFREPFFHFLEAIDMIERFTLGMDFEAFREDPKTVAAVERKLQLMSEAATRLGDQAEAICPGLPWRNIRGLGTGCGISTIGLTYSGMEHGHGRPATIGGRGQKSAGETERLGPAELTDFQNSSGGTLGFSDRGGKSGRVDSE
jgi:hypothetical protein